VNCRPVTVESNTYFGKEQRTLTRDGVTKQGVEIWNTELDIFG